MLISLPPARVPQSAIFPQPEKTMAKEIERKFLVIGDAWRALAQGIHYRQGYLSSAKERTVRIRTINDKAFLTIKGITVGVTRQEYEYEIPYDDCVQMLEQRYKIPLDGLIWEIDEFLGVNAGLIVAEIELADENQAFSKPAWIGAEVSADPRYFNSNLVKHPYTTWNQS